MISIIIPVFNEEKSIESSLRQINKLKGEKEIIVVDGGSKDHTVEIAARYAKMIHSDKGRANQMNAGAKAAKGEVLWFVHSDSIVSKLSLKAIEKAVKAGVVAGGFSLFFYNDTSFFMKYIALTSNWRAKYLRLYFGDQGIFVKKTVFDEIGGYPAIPLMEDWEFSKAMYKQGKVQMLDVPIGTSARRFHKGGRWNTFLLMQKIKLLYILGKSPNELAKIYREARE